MPFQKDNPASLEAAKKGGKKTAELRWGAKDPATVRNKQLKICFSQIERDMITSEAKERGMSIPEFIMQSINCYIDKSGRA